jgi:phenylalanyl-tRNA synthetase alpha chain
MTESIRQLYNQAKTELNSITDASQLDELVLEYFGRKAGRLNTILRSLKDLDENQRRVLGKEANDVKIEIWHLIDQKRQSIKSAGKKEFIDLTIDGQAPALGHLHPITKTRREMSRIFQNMGFAVVEMREIETDYYNFEALNIPQEHAARDMMDTYYIKGSETNKPGDKLLLRAHISTIQSHLFEQYKPPFAAVTFGRVFRKEATDARHEHTYDSAEGLVVGENISLANLTYTLTELFKQLFGFRIEMKFRSSYFPFTEPSIEIVMSCIFCMKKGCSICGQSGWLEMGGAGMTHPKVYENAGYPKDKYTGFAFGLGVSRVAMLKYNIPDIRLLMQNDVRFLKQF